MRYPNRFEMMHWAKTRVEGARFDLGASGVPSPGRDELPPVAPTSASEPDPYSSVGNYWGDPRLKDVIATTYGVDPAGVLVSDGASLANYTALAVLAGPGDRVLIENPTYPALAEILRFQGARVDPWPRPPEDGWQPSLDEISRRADDGRGDFRAVVLTRLHNPSGVDLPQGFLERLAALADRLDFHVLLDEVYLDFVDAVPGHRFSPRFVSTGSLTKVYGFSGLRVGWILGHPDTIAPMKELSFYLAVNGSTMSQSAGVRVLERRDHFLNRTRSLAAAGRDIVESWIASRDDVSWIPPAGGICGFVRLHAVDDTSALAERLFREHGVAVAEGEFFDRPGWVRVGFGAPAEELREGLRHLGNALDARQDRSAPAQR
jgi:aspartate/methionine/tyrosine aminotransferase